MKFEIKHRFNNAVLFSLKTDSLKLCVEAAVKSHAYLSGANLSGADLSHTDLSHTDLSGATGFNPNFYTPLFMLLDQPGKIRAYKLVNKYHEGPFNGGIKYIVGKVVKVTRVNSDVNVQCGFGINVATLNWCMKEWCKGRKILLVEFTAKDIAAIPSGTDRKFRVRKCKVIRALDLKKIGLTVPKEKK